MGEMELACISYSFRSRKCWRYKVWWNHWLQWSRTYQTGWWKSSDICSHSARFWARRIWSRKEQKCCNHRTGMLWDGELNVPGCLVVTLTSNREGGIDPVLYPLQWKKNAISGAVPVICSQATFNILIISENKHLIDWMSSNWEQNKQSGCAL